MGTGFKILVLLHILCVIGGFGALAFNGLYMNLAQRRPSGGTSAVLEVNRMVSGLGDALVYLAIVFGIGAVGASHRAISFGDAWVSAALAVVVVDIGILHGWIRPNQRRYSALVSTLEKPFAADEGPESRTADLVALQQLERRVGLGWAAFNVMVVGAVYLMVFQPGR